MVEAQINRRLAAILAADVVGYSRMMGADEAGTLAALKRHRESVFDPAVAEHRGRVVKLIGDGTLVEFGSVVDAVKCAMAVQLATAKAEGPTGSHKITLRIGVNLGDVIVEGDDIYGDGVNVAARLEPLAEPGGICVASIVNESVGTRIGVPFADGGEVHVKNIDRPIRVWKWHPGAATAPVVARALEAEPARQKASIAVLPFTNMSGDPEQEYFSDGITEDIITDLSKVAGLMVIARNSSFAYKGRNVDIRAVGRELGVTSVLEGSIRRAGNRVRITAQLINAGDGGHLWAERYDRDLTDIFAVQDEVTREIVAALKITLTPAEAARIASNPATVGSHDCYIRGRELLFSSLKNRKTFIEAKGFFDRAIERDPDYAEAFAGLAVLYTFDYQNRWSDDPEASLATAQKLAETAIAKNPNEAFAHYSASIVAAYTRDFDRWAAEAEAAIALNPNFAPAQNSRGIIYIFSGEPMKAIPYIEIAMRLDPGFRQQYLHFLGLAYLIDRKYETAVAMFQERVRLVPETDFTRAFLASALGHLGHLDEARQVWRDLKRVNPAYTFSDHVMRLTFKVPEDLRNIEAGLARAGLPE